MTGFSGKILANHMPKPWQLEGGVSNVVRFILGYKGRGLRGDGRGCVASTHRPGL
jgi:hypothetical protein